MTERPTPSKPDKHALLGKLRGFQRRTVDHVVKRLLDPVGSQRFLVADEVGLGKTLIARGVVAEIVDRLWDGVGRIDILYVCSNTALASENLRKIHIGGEIIEGTRLTLLPKQIADFHEKLNFVSFTPGTALQVAGYGRVDERVVLYALLRRELGDGGWLRNLLRGGVTPSYWRDRHLAELPELDQRLAVGFEARLRANAPLKAELEWARQTMLRVDSRLGDDDSRPYRIVGALRKLLAHSCIDALQPDLIILDEFQRFKDLLSSDGEEQTELAELASKLFEYVTPEKNRVATLLLSATPYRMFATDDESVGADHYEDFRDTLRFLVRDERRFAELEASLEAYRRALLNAANGDPGGVRGARDELQRRLKEVMVRTERVDSTVERDSMVEEPQIRAPLARRDLAHFMATDDIAERLGARDVVDFWKSAPYLFNFMKSYRLKEDFESQLHLKAVRQGFEQVAQEFLSVQQIQAYEEIDPANARLRALAQHSLGADQWSMLWLPPTVPYWPLGEVWKANAGYSKKLVFSAWNVVPDAISALLSYEAERRMVGDAAGSEYSRLYRRQRNALPYTLLDGRPRNMSTLALALPCLTLADEISPLALALDGQPVIEAARARVERLIERLRPLVGSGEADESWHWAALLLLDRDDESLPALLDTWDEPDDEETDADVSAAGSAPSARKDRALRVHLEEALRVLRGEAKLGAFPPTLTDVLTELALGGPAILAARALAPFGVGPAARRQAAVRVANGFRKLFNQPPVIRMLRGSADDQRYWRATLNYAIEGNLQAVLDEQVHLLWEQYAWDDKPPDEVCEKVAETLHDSVTTKVSRVMPDLYASGERSIKQADAEDEGGKRERIALRTSFALRYGAVKGASDTIEAREESVRTAFKSPFFPFVLVSTSVGQEGLDFHPWCHDVWHWNLPGNPVDLEQREGRVHRYKGLAVRKNVAENAMAVLRERWRPGQDPWEVLFTAAEERYRDMASDLIPYWVAPGPHKVRRCVPILPFSSEIGQLRRLKRSLAIYRVVFGQPRQEELLGLLEQSDVDREELELWMVSLKPE